MRRLLVIVSDRISNIIDKGELIDNYYNTGNYFDEVGILLTNDDHVDKEKLQKAVGTAKLEIFNMPTGQAFILKTLGWRPALLKKWAQKGVQIAQEYKPDIIRCYGCRLSGFLSAYIKEHTGIPYVLSMHESPDDIVKSEKSFLRTCQYALLESMMIKSLKEADFVIAVYDSIILDLKKRHIDNYKVIHNAVNSAHIVKKESYSCDTKDFKLVSVGRLINIKNPKNLVKAVSGLENVSLEIIGDGAKYEAIKELITELNCDSRIKMIKAVDNDELCERLHEFDVFAINCNSIEVPKTVIEAWLVGMPILKNHPVSGETTEYTDGKNLLLVDDSVDGYREGIIKLMQDENLRRTLGQGGLLYAEENFLPAKMDEQVIELYEEILNRKQK